MLGLAEGIDAGISAVQIEDDRHDHPLLPCVAQHPVTLLPERHVVTGHVEAGLLHAVGPLGHPGVQPELELVGVHDQRLEPPIAALGSSAQGHPNPVHLQSGKPVDGLPDHVSRPASRGASRSSCRSRSSARRCLPRRSATDAPCRSAPGPGVCRPVAVNLPEWACR